MPDENRRHWLRCVLCSLGCLDSLGQECLEQCLAFMAVQWVHCAHAEPSNKAGVSCFLAWLRKELTTWLGPMAVRNSKALVRYPAPLLQGVYVLGDDRGRKGSVEVTELSLTSPGLWLKLE